jgi:tetratricopeptide (TPR) repeat protein
MAIVTLEEIDRPQKAMFEKGASALERSNYDYAIDIFLTLLESEPGLLQARQLLRAAEIKKFREKKGGELAHTISSITGIGTVMAAQGALKKDPLKALTKVEALLKKDPLNKQFLDLHAKAALAADMPEAAVHSISIAQENYPEDKGIMKRLANLYVEVGDTQKAKETFEKLMKMEPENQEYIKAYKDAAARDTMQTGGWEGAKDYRDLIKDKGEAQRLEQTAKAVKTTKDVSDLISETELKVKQDPDNINYKRALADLYAKADRHEEALQILDEAQAQTGGGDPQVDRSITSIKIAYFDRQIKELETAGDQAGAEAKRAEKSDFVFENTKDRTIRYPNDLQIKYEYGVLLFERGEINEAVQQFQLSQRNPQKRINSLYYLARCFKQKEQFDIAAEQLEKAASELHVMSDQKKEVIYELGETYEAMGDREKALKYFKEIYSVDISYKEVARKIEGKSAPKSE